MNNEFWLIYFFIGLVYCNCAKVNFYYTLFVKHRGYYTVSHSARMHIMFLMIVLSTIFWLLFCIWDLCSYMVDIDKMHHKDKNALK